jgi:hypothetical protein
MSKSSSTSTTRFSCRRRRDAAGAVAPGLLQVHEGERREDRPATRRLRWSSPLLFNDPFDVTQELRLNFDSTG